MTIIFATGNSCKLREASEILGEGFELVTPADKGITEDIPETGTTLRANSLQKAQYIFDHTGGADCFADDRRLPHGYQKPEQICQPIQGCILTGAGHVHAADQNGAGSDR